MNFVYSILYNLPSFINEIEHTPKEIIMKADEVIHESPDQISCLSKWFHEIANDNLIDLLTLKNTNISVDNKQIDIIFNKSRYLNNRIKTVIYFKMDGYIIYEILLTHDLKSLLIQLYECQIQEEIRAKMILNSNYLKEYLGAKAIIKTLSN